MSLCDYQVPVTRYVPPTTVSAYFENIPYGLVRRGNQSPSPVSKPTHFSSGKGAGDLHYTFRSRLNFFN